VRLAAPRSYLFNDADIEDYSERFVPLNPDLVPSGQLADLWRESGTRGGGVSASMLPVLAIETWPGMRRDRAAVDGTLHLAKPSPDWTPWASASHRRIATVAGIALSSVRVGYEMLARRDLCQFATVPCAVSLGRRRTYYRLATSLYRSEGQAFAPIRGSLLYGGHWTMLPTNAARHLYLVLAALDPVYDADVLGGILDGGTIEERRQRYAVSWGRLERFSGLSRRTLVEALGVLTTPLKNYPPYFERGGGSPYWYARQGPEWWWLPDFLNSSTKNIRENRARTWPEVADRLSRESRARLAIKKQKRRAVRVA